MDYETIILEKRGNVAVLTLNRPERLNAISPQMSEEMSVALDELDDDDEARVLVITGAGRGFCSGADVGGMVAGRQQVESAGRGSEAMRQGLVRSAGRVMPRLQKLKKPTIAMVNGAAVGAGCDLAMGCDMRTGCEKTRFMNAFVRIGLFPGWGGTWLYPRVMGVGRALEFLFTGDFMEAEEAGRLGVLNRLVASEELEKETMALATRIADGPPIPMRLAKMQVYKGLNMEFETALNIAAACETITLSSEDHREGVAAFREKRKPEFKGR